MGDVIGGFKAAVSREMRRRGDACAALRVPRNVRIWHRNYYESIVRTPEAARRIAVYIRMNPWRCVQEFGKGLRGIGNPALLNREKIGMLCSRNCPPETLSAAMQRAIPAGAYCCFLSGFHSPPEKAILETLLQSEASMICCPAWGIDTMRIPAAWLPALETNRMLILEMPRSECGATLAAHLCRPEHCIWRRGRDSNPRYPVEGTNAFQAFPIDHSGTSPWFSVGSEIKAERGGDCQGKRGGGGIGVSPIPGMLSWG